ncbi:peptidyl-prolyl cis-trans isomerase D [Klebsiella pneumoniae subsp. ozaenae]|uniref:Periplasmic chaperone PpiD n=1 Tax=Klebsiella pneumoniae subsp. ozaenae TaxID=574 RepID=A0A378BWW5_KLEPO|nr:peptidyl-prolyl cis-trans isomerase D [Klebsiella pneumoniae subsp. ozaenae]
MPPACRRAPLTTRFSHGTDQHKDQFTQPQRNRYSVIQTKTEADAKAVLAELQKGADFATLAKEKSTDIISARNGGDIGVDGRCLYRA